MQHTVERYGPHRRTFFDVLEGIFKAVDGVLKVIVVLVGGIIGAVIVGGFAAGNASHDPTIPRSVLNAANQAAVIPAMVLGFIAGSLLTALIMKDPS